VQRVTFIDQAVLRDPLILCCIRPAICHEEGRDMTGTSPFSVRKGGCTKLVSGVRKVADTAQVDPPMVLQSTHSRR
jgi:hypothetical protein